MTKKLKKNVFLIFQTPDHGGTRTCFFQLTDYLLKRNYKIYLLVKNTEFTGMLPMYCKEKNIAVNIYIDEIKLLPLYSFENLKTVILIGYNYLKQILFLRKLHKQVKPGVTIVSQGWPFIWFKALFIPGKIFFFSHVMPLHPLDIGNKLLLKFGLFLRKCTFVPVSDFAADKIRKYWIGNYSKIMTIHNYFEKKIYSISDQQENLLLDHQTDTLSDSGAELLPKITVLNLTRVDDVKNPFAWIEVAREIIKIRSNVRFIWAGDGSLLEEARGLTETENEIRFIGYKANVDDVYATADIYFAPTKSETHGIAVVGALAYGIPAIVTDNGGTVESVIDGYNGYVVNVADKEQMIGRLLKLIDDKELRLEMGKKAHKRWKEMFTKEIWEQKMDKLLDLV